MPKKPTTHHPAGNPEENPQKADNSPIEERDSAVFPADGLLANESFQLYLDNDNLYYQELMLLD